MRSASAGRTLLGTGLAAGLAALALAAGGGQGVPSEAAASIAVLTVGAALVVAAGLRAPAGGAHGALAVGLFAALTAWVALSVGWSVAPDESAREATRTLAWLAAFAGGAALARLSPRSGPAVLGGVLGAAVVVSAYALGTKVLPAALAPDEVEARLREPFAYWNAVGLMAALGVPAALWLGARREGRARVSILGAPACALLLATLLLAQSRGALLALALALVGWFACAPLRLRGAVVLGLGLAGGLPIALWAFGRPALSDTGVPLAAREDAGAELGLLLLAMLALAAGAALAVRRLRARRALTLAGRRRAGAALLAVVALALTGGLLALGTKPGGVRGQVSAAWDDVTDTTAAPPRGAERLTATASARARYWKEARDVWRTAELRGVGAGGFEVARLAIARDGLVVRHAHGYVPQTLADLGLVGLALSLALLAAWGRAATRAAPPRAGPLEAEPGRAAAVTLLAVAGLFLVHVFVDWTWNVPATAAAGLGCAGWLAGRGPAVEGDRPAARPSPLRFAAALAVLVLAAAGAWGALDVLRAHHGTERGVDQLADGRIAAGRATLVEAAERDPRSPDALLALGSLEVAADRPAAARRALVAAVRRAPDSPRTWSRLGRYDLATGRLPAAGRELARAFALAPHDPVLRVARAQLDAAVAAAAAAAPAPAPAPPPAP